jgi:hypothetical protein
MGQKNWSSCFNSESAIGSKIREEEASGGEKRVKERNTAQQML